MTIEGYGRRALAQPEAVESSHMAHPDFQVRRKIFATIRSVAKGEGVVKLTPRQQFVKQDAEAFAAVPGGWGSKGWTLIRLGRVTARIVRPAMECAWRNAAPKRLIAQTDAATYRSSGYAIVDLVIPRVE